MAELGMYLTRCIEIGFTVRSFDCLQSTTHSVSHAYNWMSLPTLNWNFSPVLPLKHNASDYTVASVADASSCSSCMSCTVVASLWYDPLAVQYVRWRGPAYLLMTVPRRFWTTFENSKCRVLGKARDWVA